MNMKITTKAVFDMATMELIESESYEYEGAIAYCKGKGGGSAPANTTTKTTTEPWAGQKPFLKDSYQETGNLQQQQFFNGQTYVGRNNLELDADQQRLDYAQNVMPDQVGRAQDSWQNSLQAMDVANNPYVNNMMDQNATAIGDNFSRNILPSIRNNSISAGQSGGSRQGIAEGLAAGEAQKSLAMANAKTQSDAYQTGAGLQEFALQFSPEMANLGLQPANVQEFVGQGVREDQAQVLQEEMARWQQYQSEPERLAGARATILNGGAAYGDSTSNISGANPYQRSGFQDALGYASAGAGAYDAYSNLSGTLF